MTADEIERLHAQAARLERARDAAELTREMLRRSYDQLATSRELLRIEAPKVWHPAPAEIDPFICLAPSGSEKVPPGNQIITVAPPVFVSPK